MDIYNADGYLDKQRYVGKMNELLGGADAAVAVVGWAQARPMLAARLTELLDAVAGGFSTDPLAAPDVTREEINLCRPVSRWGWAPAEPGSPA